MESVHGDPRLFSLLSKSRGRKGVRDLQGPELRKKLMTILECMVSAYDCVDKHMTIYL